MDSVYSISALSFSKTRSVIVEVQGIVLGAGSGELVLTGNLGTAAYEAMLVAKTVLWCRNKTINNFDYHLHFSYPGVKKEGPSWGVACYIMLSWLSGQLKYKKGLAATGEIDLKGNIKQVTYLDEKMAAWAKSECSYLIIPRMEAAINVAHNVFSLNNVDQLFPIINSLS